MSKSHDTDQNHSDQKSGDTSAAGSSADKSPPLKRKRVAGLAKFAKSAGDDLAGERIAKAMARAGLCSRRDAETWIADGRVSVNGKVLETPAITVSGSDRILVDGEPLPLKERTRLFLYHKPRGLVTTTSDPEGRPTVFEALPADLPRVVTVGRLDINTEGLLLLTNDGGLARVLELPATGWLRRYRVRAFGEVTKEQLDALKDGVTIEGISYGPVEAEIDTVTGSNVWLMVGLREGKNREVKRILQHLGLTVNRLIRISFGPFQLGDLDDGEVREIRGKVLREQLGPRLVDEAGADFEAPIIHHIAGGEGDEARPARGDKTSAAKSGAEKRSSGDSPRKRQPRTQMEFLGTGDDGSRQARLNREGKPSVSVKYKPRSPEDGPRAARGARSDKPEGRGFAPRDRGQGTGRDGAAKGDRPFRAPRGDRPERTGTDRPERSLGDRPRFAGGSGDGARPARGPRPERRDGDRPERAARPDGPGDQTWGDQKRARPSGDRPRPAGSGDRPPRGARPDRSPSASGQDRAPRDGAERRFSERPRNAAAPSGDRPARGPRLERGDRPAGDEPFRSQGFKDRAPDGGGRPSQNSGGGRPSQNSGGGRPARDAGDRAKPEQAARPYRSEGARDRPSGGFSDRPKRDGDRPDRPTGPRGPGKPGGGGSGPRGPRTGGAGGKDGAPRGGSGSRGGPGADRRR